jgi:hypothetical protein
MKYNCFCILVIYLLTFIICEQNTFLKKNPTDHSNPTNPTVNGDTSEMVEPKIYKGYCFMKIKNNMFDINSFNLIKPWKLLDHHGKPIYFNFCSNVDTSCQPNQSMIAEPSTCKNFAGKSDQDKTWTLSKDKTGNHVLYINFPTGDHCSDAEFYQTTVELTCDKKVSVPVITNNRTFNQKKCSNIIKMRSKHGNYFI